MTVFSRCAARAALVVAISCGAVLVASPSGAGLAPDRTEASSVPFWDVAPGNPFGSAIRWMSDHGLSSGFDDGTFRPAASVSRQAVAAFLYRSAGAPEGPEPPCTAAPFADVDPSHPFCGEIAWVSSSGVAEGYGDGSFRPDLPVTRQAAAAFLHRSAGFGGGVEAPCAVAAFVDVDPGHPFCDAIAWMGGEALSVGYGDGTFGAERAVTREALAAFMHRLWLTTVERPPVPSPACGTTTAGPVFEERFDIVVDGVERWFLLTVFKHDGANPVPLVVDFHGLSEGASLHTGMSEYSDFAIEEGFSVVFPQGSGSPVGWDVSHSAEADLDFVDAMLDDLGQRYCLDEARTYATGLSNGAMMSSRLACSRSSRFAAIAAIAGVVMPEPCGSERPVPVLAIHGTDDPILFYEGGVGLDYAGDEEDPVPPSGIDLTKPFPEHVAAWAARNGCNPTAVDEPVTAEVILRSHRCPVDAEVQFYIVLGGGHAWPGSSFSSGIEFAVGYTTFDIHATRVSWDFMERFSVPPL